MALTASLRGPRLEFVVRELKGQKEVTRYGVDKKGKKVVAKTVKEEAGYMLYLPSGHSYRLTGEQLRKQGYDRVPKIINLDSVQDPNTAAGMIKFGVTDAVRKKGWTMLEDQMIRRCTRRGQLEDETGVTSNVAA